MNEGSKVAYVGEDVTVGVGAVGRILSTAGSSQHVQWISGEKVGSIDLVPNEDLIPHRTAAPVTAQGVASQFDQALDVPSMLTVAVRDTYDTHGEDGLLNALDEAGHLATLSGYASEAISAIAGNLRQDPTFAQVLSQLDEFEAESLLVRVAVNLLTSEEG